MRLFVNRDHAISFIFFEFENISFDFNTTNEPSDQIMDFGKFSIHIDNNSRPFLDNLVLDFTKTGLGEEFIFNNPNVTASCGCGVSMTFNPV